MFFYLQFIAGESLVNGVQVNYRLPTVTVVTNSNTSTTSSKDATDRKDLQLKSPTFSSTNDSPVKHTFKLSPSDRVVHVAVRSGALVDSLHLRTSSGVQFSVGGSGGGEARELDIPDGWTLYGFYGGTFIVHQYHDLTILKDRIG
jgi:hypothetical protein